MGSQDAQNPQGSDTAGTSGNSTPRVEYFDGEIPPALSPLDAFALQGRLLAKQFDESRKAGRRLSRLPPSSVERSLSQPRPGYSRAQSSGESNKSPVSPRFRENTGNLEIEDPKNRPQSQHPQLGGTPSNNARNTEESVPPLPSHDFGAPLAQSPEESTSSRSDADEKVSGKKQPRAIGIGVTGVPKQSSQDSSSKAYPSNTLAPPPSAPGPNSGSGGPGMTQAQHESSDDDYYASSNAGSTFSKPRKLSSGSVVSMPSQSPTAHPHRNPPPRSPSPTSDMAGMTQGLPRPFLNFSRPISRSSTSVSLPSPLVEAPQKSADEPQTEPRQREHRPPPIEVPQWHGPAGDETQDGQPSAGNSYIYAKYTLPRGRAVSRNSLVFAGLQTPHFEWKEPLFESSPPPSAKKPADRPDRTPSPPRTMQSQQSCTSSAPRTPTAKASPAKLVKNDRSPTDTPRRSSDRPAEEKGPTQKRVPSDKLAVKPQSQPQPQPQQQSQRAEKSEDATKTVPSSSLAADNNDTSKRPSTSRTIASEREVSNSQLSADEHVEKGIACHENGSVKESTYHLRRAAMQQHPTGMLLYALACRHGWGMRPNQKEGVQWLRKAVDSAGLDLNRVVDNPAGEPRGRFYQEQKALQAQFALGLYELGVSHLNGWGIEQDKALALRCFEIAGRWGDADALAEAGFCYAEGIGSKKDLKKAAKYYRMAESKGMSMIGNSWYVCF